LGNGAVNAAGFDGDERECNGVYARLAAPC
jgi:hypothetical protein